MTCLPTQQTIKKTLCFKAKLTDVQTMLKNPSQSNMCPQDFWTQDTLELVAHHFASCRIACTQTLSDQGGRRKGEWHLRIFAEDFACPKWRTHP